MGRNTFLSVFTKLHVGLSVILAQVLLGDLEHGVMTFDRKNDVQLLIGLPLGYNETLWVLLWRGYFKTLNIYLQQTSQCQTK